MSLSGRRSRRWGLAVVLALALLSVPALPSAADHAPPPGDLAGSGAVEGTELVEEQGFTGTLCFRARRTLFGLRGTGSYHGRTATGQEVVYRADIGAGETRYASGPLQIQVENTEVYYHGPFGTHGTADTACGAATANSPVPAEFRIFAAEQTEDVDGDLDVDVLGGQAWVYRLDESNQKVPCRGQGSFSRAAQQDDPNWRAQWILDEDCVVVGNDQEASATHTVRIDLNTFSRVGGLTLPAEDRPRASVIDPAGRFAYFGGNNLVKVDLDSFSRVGALPIGASSGVIEPAGRFAYFAAGTGSGTPARVVKVDLATFEQVGAIDLVPGEENPNSALMDPAGRYAYFGAANQNGQADFVKVDLATFQRVGSLLLEPGEGSLNTAVIAPDGNHAYLGIASVQNQGRVVKIDLRTFQRAGTLTLNGSEESFLDNAVIDPSGHFAYFGSYSSHRVIKVDLTTFQRVGALVLPEDESPESSVIDPAGRFAYVGTRKGFNEIDRIVKIDLSAFERVGALVLPEDERYPYSAVMDPAGRFAYFNVDPSPLTFVDPPAKIVKVAVSRPPSPDLVASPESYDTSFDTPLTVAAPGVLANDEDTGDGDPLTARQASDPARGSVTLSPDGSFTYTPDAGFSGTDSFTYTASDGRDLSAPATVTVEVAAAPVRGAAFGFSSSVSLFGGPAQPRGPEPSVTLPTGGSATPVTATAPTGEAVYGPAFIFTSDQIDVSTQGEPGGTVSSSTAIANVNRSEQEVLTAANMASSCTASSSGRSGSTTITGGRLRVSEGEPNVEGDDTIVTLPVNPLPNTVYNGQLESVGDYFQYIFNEQVLNPDGSITVYAAHQKLLGPTAIGDLYIGKSECGVTSNRPPPAEPAAVADFDGDGATDASVFRPSTGVWYLRQSTGGDRAVEFGADGDVPVPGDYDGDGTTDLGVYRPANGVWYLRQSAAGDSASQFGAGGDVAVPGDYDGDGATDLGVYRPSTGVWYLRQSTAGDRATPFGAEGDVATPGDYDGDGITDLAVYRPSTGVWYARQSTDGDRASQFGVDGDVPVPGDYDADGTTDLGIYRPATGTWYLRRSTGGDTASSFGVDGDVPVPGDYDGDGTTDLGVHRPETNVWYLRRSTTGDTATQFGAPGDIPLPAAIRQGAVP